MSTKKTLNILQSNILDFVNYFLRATLLEICSYITSSHIYLYKRLRLDRSLISMSEIFTMETITRFALQFSNICT